MNNKCYAIFMSDVVPLIEALLKCEEDAGIDTESLGHLIGPQGCRPVTGQVQKRTASEDAQYRRMHPLTEVKIPAGLFRPPEMSKELRKKLGGRVKSVVDIAEREGLTLSEQNLFIQFMARRYPNESLDYYQEWAERFKKSPLLTGAPDVNLVYQMADAEGRVILDDMAQSYKFWGYGK